MATEAIFAADAPAGSHNDATTYDLGLVFRADLGGSVVGVSVYGPTVVPGSVTVSLYSVDSDTTGTLLAAKLAPAPLVSGQWNGIVFDAPVAITAGVYYCAQWRTDSGYTFTAGKFTAQAYTVGHLTAIRHDFEPDAPSGGPYNNGRLLVGSGFASSDGNGAWYGVDVLVNFGGTVVTGAGAAAATSTGIAAGRVRVRAAGSAAATSPASAAGKVRVRAAGSAAATSTGLLTIPELYTPAGWPVVTTTDARPLVTRTEVWARDL